MTGPGAAAEFEPFVRRFQDMVFATAVRLLGNTADAEDVAQSVFLRAFQRFDELRENPAAAGWLKTVTRNLCLNHLTRYRSRWRFFSELDAEFAQSAATFYPSALVSAASPVLDLESEEEREHLEQALRSLPDHQRVPLVLFHMEEMSYQEIASTLRVSLAKVKTDIHRGREALRKYLTNAAPH
jgi:RNA polymerase sigma-70 factor (ECF subfamily)